MRIEFKMETVPDGSLCRITSSAKDIVNNIKIVKVSEDELQNPDEQQYRLVFIGEEENDSQSLSEKSDEEPLEHELFHETDIKLSEENIEKDKDIQIQIQEVVDESKRQNEKSPKRAFNKRFNKPKNKQQNHRNYKFSGSRNFNSSGNSTKPFNRLKANERSQDIEPWVINPFNALNSLQFAIYPQYSPVMNNSVNSDKPTTGLLGDSPYSHFPQHNYQSNNQSNSFGHGQNFWNRDYTNYPTSTSNRQISNPSANNRHYRNKHWNNNRGRSKSWKRNHN